jgi:hypothetical protein
MCLLFQLHTDVLLGQDNGSLMGFYILSLVLFIVGVFLSPPFNFFLARMPFTVQIVKVQLCTAKD